MPIMTHPSSLEALGVYAEAAQDLVTAGLEISLGRMFACADACNQAVEKALQAVIITRLGHRAPYDHDLVELGTRAGAPPDLAEALAMLTGYYPETFYAHTPPELADDAVSPDDAAACLAQAKTVLRWARGIVMAN
jgi:HEPN domain-containing protein